ncbi:MAG: hypothetical protein COX07_03155 [Bacteroidetes bacterium CG23_combo_of_CG06-09_8_20_14_all_32_9]|nr:MAG: hypothetical protein COX07_03155 [Bacteroidetes bacterium CG23_combo_of_CG06-09_8_20_14_all_32_9]
MNHKISLHKKLFSANEKEVIYTLKNISKKKYFELVTNLIDLFAKSTSKNIKNEVFNILINLKDNNSVKYFMEGLIKQTDANVRLQLISACWQNGLNYSPYINYFIEIICNESITHAIEAYSVIEMNYMKLDEKQLSIFKENVKKLKNQSSGENLKLLIEVESLVC